MSKSFITVAVCAALGGCAIGNTYDYRASRVALPLVGGTGEIGIAVVDRRPDVVSGDREPDFVGLQRGGFNNPFNVSTTSGNPLVVDMQAVLARALEDKGYEVTELSLLSPDDSAVAQVVRQNGARRNVVLILNEWMTDAMMRFRLTYDVLLQIVDENYRVLAEAGTNAVEEEVGGAGMESQNSRRAAQLFETKVSRLFNDPEIKSALGSE